MDLGIKGRWALVCAASKGLGKGCAAALASEGANIVITARGAEALEATASALRRANPDIEVHSVQGDITTVDGRSRALAAAPQIDILVTNAGGPPPGDFRQWNRDDWLKAIDANMLTPIELIKAVIDGMCDRGFGRIVNITSGAVKAPIDALGLSNGSRSGLTGFVAGLARQPRVAGRNVTVNNLLPGPFATDRMNSIVAAQATLDGTPAADVLAARVARNPSGRLGDAAEFGAACAFLCSRHAGFITGQNLLIDGGEYPGTF